MAILQIDQQSRVPIYEQLRQQVLRLAALGLLEEDEQMPSVRQLASDLGINPNTVQKAYRELEREELIYTVPGKGSFLASAEIHIRRVRETLAEEMQKIIEQGRKAGFTPEEIREMFNKAMELAGRDKGQPSKGGKENA